LNKGADGACGDDAAGLKIAVVNWLIAFRPTPEPALEARNKSGRGFYHNTTAWLLCPVDYNWSDAEYNIHNFHPDYLVTADSWPTFLYKNEQYNPENPSKRIFKNTLLVKTFRHIFTSPGSADSNHTIDDNVGTGGGPSSDSARKRQKGLNKRHTRSHVAALLGMKAVSPRAIAYAAPLPIQLRFALSSCGSWRIQDEDFNYDDFYNNIVTFFEGAETVTRKAEIKDILLWWNR
ncbi:hypothetical protein BDN67DRAFT_913681, partial [Paxillus ammoniavirescens]